MHVSAKGMGWVSDPESQSLLQPLCDPEQLLSLALSFPRCERRNHEIQKRVIKGSGPEKVTIRLLNNVHC